MAKSCNIIFLILILVISIHHLDSTLTPRSQPVSPCCQQTPYFSLFSYSPCTCPPPVTTPPPKRVPIDFKFGELALKPIQILAGASHLALGTILNVGGMPFKFIGSIATNGGHFAETLGYDLKTTGALKVSDGVSGITSFLQKLGQPSSVICVVKGDNINVYQTVEEKKKVEKVEKVDKVAKVEKVAKVASPCCQRSPVFTLFSYSPCACQPSAPTTHAPFGSGIKEIAFKPFEILAGASHLALGTILNVGGMPFKFIGTISKNGGEFAETLGYELKTTGVNKVSSSISSITSFLQKLGQPAPVICVVQDGNINIYQPVAKKEKVEKVGKIEKVEKIEKIDKTTKIKVEPVPYSPTTVKYDIKTQKLTTKYVPISTYAPTTPITTTTIKPTVNYVTEATKTTFNLPSVAYDNMPVSDLPYLDDGSPLVNEPEDVEE